MRGAEGSAGGRLVLSGLLEEDEIPAVCCNQNMSVTESTREAGLDLAKNDLLYTFDGVECMVNQAQSHSAGTLYLTKE